MATVADVPPQVEWFANLSWQTQYRRAGAPGEGNSVALAVAVQVTTTVAAPSREFDGQVDRRTRQDMDLR